MLRYLHQDLAVTGKEIDPIDVLSLRSRQNPHGVRKEQRAGYVGPPVTARQRMNISEGSRKPAHTCATGHGGRHDRIGAVRLGEQSLVPGRRIVVANGAADAKFGRRLSVPPGVVSDMPELSRCKAPLFENERE